METPDLKHCPICTQDLPVSEFGICQARKDGRNLYCKSCIREKVTRSRRALKEYKTNRKRILNERYQQQLVAMDTPDNAILKQSPIDRVRDAIRDGARTQREIALETKLGKDEIGDVIANLLLWTNEITTKLIGDTRFYFLKVEQVEAAEVIRPRSSSLVDIARKHCGPVVRGTKEIRRIA